MEKFKERFWNYAFIFLIFVLAGLMIYLISVMQVEVDEKGNTAGAVFVGSINDGGWNEAHYKGLVKSCETRGMNLEIAENVGENYKSCKPVIDSMVKKGASIIFLTSDGYGAHIYKICEEYPQVFFYSVSPKCEPKNMASYYGRMYQARYLAGIIAGRMTKSHVLGYVAAKNNSQVDRGINAYLLGARSVDPKALCKVIIIGSWSDPDAEKKAAEKLIDTYNADVMSIHSSTSAALEVAEKKGIYSIDYNTFSEKKHKNSLASLTFKWDTFYASILQDYMKGNMPMDDTAYWWGIQRNAVAIDHISEKIDKATKAEVNRVSRNFATGFDPFLDEIKDNTGKIRCRDGERISDLSLLYDMDWYVEGVEIVK